MDWTVGAPAAAGEPLAISRNSSPQAWAIEMPGFAGQNAACAAAGESGK